LASDSIRLGAVSYTFHYSLKGQGLLLR